MADTLIMFFSDADKAIVKHYHEKRYTACKIWKDNPQKHCNKASAKRLIKRFETFGTLEKQKGSGHSRTATTPENEESVEEMICSQEDLPETHVPPKDISEGLKISQSSVRRMIKRKGIKQFKHLKTPYMNYVTRKRSTA